MTPFFVLAQQDLGGEVAAGGGLFILAILIGLASLALTVWAIIDAVRNPALSDTERIVWILVILFVGCLGPLLYLLIGRNKGTGTTRPGGPAV